MYFRGHSFHTFAMRTDRCSDKKKNYQPCRVVQNRHDLVTERLLAALGPHTAHLFLCSSILSQNVPEVVSTHLSLPPAVKYRWPVWRAVCQCYRTAPKPPVCVAAALIFSNMRSLKPSFVAASRNADAAAHTSRAHPRQHQASALGSWGAAPAVKVRWGCVAVGLYTRIPL